MRLRITHTNRRPWGTEAIAFIINTYDPSGGGARRHMGRNIKMIVVDLPSGLKIGFSFTHQNNRKPSGTGWVVDPQVVDGVKHMVAGVCVVELYKLRGTEAQLYATGRAICKVPDSYNKATGRKHALIHALDKHMLGVVKDPPRLFTRDDRIAIWNAYWHSLEPQQQQPTPATPVMVPPTPAPVPMQARIPVQDIGGHPIPGPLM